jgi:hypothetical protein
MNNHLSTILKNLYRFFTASLTICLLTAFFPSFLEAAEAPLNTQSSNEGATGSSQLREVESLYATGEYSKAAQRLNNLLEVESTLASSERAQIYLMKARLELAFDRDREIKPWLRKAYQANPNLSLDPVKDPPQLLARWDEIKTAANNPTLQSKTDKTKSPEGRSTSPQYITAQASPSPFFIGLLPFGLGHFDAGRYKDGALFLSTELLVLLTANTIPRPKKDSADDDYNDSQRRQDEKRGKTNATILGTVTFLGAYGFELYDMLPDLSVRSASATSSLRFGLSFMPFGVAQAKNGNYLKAFGMGAIQTTLLTMGTLTDKEEVRRFSLGMFVASWAYGILDGILGHSSSYDAETNAPKTVFRPVHKKIEVEQFALLPTWNSKYQPGAMLKLTANLYP